MKFLIACFVLIALSNTNGERIKRDVIAASPYYSPYAPYAAYAPYSAYAPYAAYASYVAPNPVIARASRVVGQPGFAAKYYAAPAPIVAAAPAPIVAAAPSPLVAGATSPYVLL